MSNKKKRTIKRPKTKVPTIPPRNPQPQSQPISIANTNTPEPEISQPPQRYVTFLENGQILVPDTGFRTLDDLFGFLQTKVYQDWGNRVFLRVQKEIVERNSRPQQPQQPPVGQPPEGQPQPPAPITPPNLRALPPPEERIPDPPGAEPIPDDDEEFEEVDEDTLMAELQQKLAEAEELKNLLKQAKEAEGTDPLPEKSTGSKK